MSAAVLPVPVGISGRHLQQRVAAGVQGALQLPHVLVLLWVDPVVREAHRQAIQIEPHRHRRRRRFRRLAACLHGADSLAWCG